MGWLRPLTKGYHRSEVRGLENFPHGGALVILYSANLQESLQAVQRAGGTITQEIFRFPGGRRFQFREPGGSEMAVWSEV